MIIAYVGPPGSGKTVAMVDHALKLFRKSPRAVYSNMAGFHCPEYVYCEAAEEFSTLSSGLVLLDEAGVVFGSRDWQGRTKQDIAAFAQVRKEGLDLTMTAQHENRLDTILRENCSEYRRCRRIGRFIVIKKLDPHADRKNASLGHVLVCMTSGLWRQYDTFARIGGRGGTVGSGASNLRPVSRVAAKRSERIARERAEADRKLRLSESIWQKGGNVRRLTPEACSVSADMERVGYGVVGGRVVLDALQYEVSRRRWLAYWGLTWEDVSLRCDFDNPWLEGYSPDLVHMRNDKARAEQIVQDIIVQADRRAQARAAKTLGAAAGAAD